MPPGSELLENQQWQPVPGYGNAEIFPYLRKVDTNSSNSYIISTPSQIIVIDPGGYAEQMDTLAAEVEKLRTAHRRPVFVYLTHTHVDHFIIIQSHPFFKGPINSIIAAHEAGAKNLENADTRVTQAALFNTTLHPVHVPMRFFSPNLEPETDFFEICPMEAPCVRVQESDIRIDEGLTLKRQVVVTRKDDRIEIYHLPGHSPDSICIRVGSLLFIGDLLFAANPGIAGSCGWNQKDLLESLQKIQWILAHEDIRACCPGHGRLVSTSAATAVFDTMKKETYFLAEIEEVNPEWAEKAAQYAEDLMNRVAETFTIMAGRCYRAAHILDELEETGDAENLSGLVCLDTIDEILADFHRFHEQYRSGTQRPVHLALKAGQITGKLESVSRKGQLDLVIQPYLVKRAERLLSDYMTTFRGFRPAIVREERDLDGLVQQCIGMLTLPPLSDEDLISLSDDESQYRQALVRRLVHVPVFEDNPISFAGSNNSISVVADSERLKDLLIGVLEDIAGSGGTAIEIVTDREPGQAYITVTASMDSATPGIPGNLRFMKKECELSGGILSGEKTGKDVTVTIELPAT